MNMYLTFKKLCSCSGDFPTFRPYLFYYQLRFIAISFIMILRNEPVHEKTNNLHMRKQRRRPASR